MKKIVTLFSIFFCTILLTGCSEIDVDSLSDEDLDRLNERLIVCNEPYIRVGMECCLDLNQNGICDEHENQNGQVKSTHYESDKTSSTQENDKQSQENIDKVQTSHLNEWKYPLTMYFFYGEDNCIFCNNQREFNTQLIEEFSSLLTIKTFEIYDNKKNYELFNYIQSSKNIEASGGVPFTIIGDTYFIGFGLGFNSDSIQEQIEYCLQHDCKDPTFLLIQEFEEVYQKNKQLESTQRESKEDGVSNVEPPKEIIKDKETEQKNEDDIKEEESQSSTTKDENKTEFILEGSQRETMLDRVFELLNTQFLALENRDLETLQKITYGDLEFTECFENFSEDECWEFISAFSLLDSNITKEDIETVIADSNQVILLTPIINEEELFYTRIEIYFVEFENTLYLLNTRSLGKPYKDSFLTLNEIILDSDGDGWWDIIEEKAQTDSMNSNDYPRIS